ncbi:hypothetical protein KAW18_16145 [candidate division WOR-3 bacterium]|nr:hypothetical protein [candidate division WOR-3 bacterium]
MNKKETKAYMHAYYLKHKEERHLEYVRWCEGNPKRNRAERGKESKTPAELKKYGRDYYANNKKRYSELHRRWCAENPKQFADGQQAWRDKNPHYPGDYARKRLAVVDPLIFQFLDSGGLGEDTGEFIQYLHSQGVPERHINWFKTDLNNRLSGKTECRRP